MSKDTTIGAGHRRRIQVRKANATDFTEARKQLFLDHLASCCHIGRAAAAAGVCTQTVYNHRNKDEGFAARLETALATGYLTLEAAMLERAAGAAPYVAGPAVATAPGPESIDTELALALLRMHKAAAKPHPRTGGPVRTRVTEAELNATLIAKLDVLDRRLAAKAARRKAGR